MIRKLFGMATMISMGVVAYEVIKVHTEVSDPEHAFVLLMHDRVFILGMLVMFFMALITLVARAVAAIALTLVMLIFGGMANHSMFDGVRTMGRESAVKAVKSCFGSPTIKSAETFRDGVIVRTHSAKENKDVTYTITDENGHWVARTGRSSAFMIDGCIK